MICLELNKNMMMFANQAALYLESIGFQIICPHKPIAPCGITLEKSVEERFH
jgi:hypothetical protein